MTVRLREPERSRVLAGIKRDYENGATIREIAARIAFSYTATREMLLSAGVQFRPPHDHKAPVVSLGTAAALLRSCDRCSASAGDRCWDQYGIRTRRVHAVRRRADHQAAA